MTEQAIQPPHTALIHALVELSARCASQDPRPTVSDVFAIANEIATEHKLSSGDSAALRNAAEALAAPLIDPPEDDDSYDHDSLFTHADTRYPALSGEQTHQASVTVLDDAKPRPRSTRRMFAWRVAPFAIAVGLIVIAGAAYYRTVNSACEAATNDATNPVHLLVCQHEYASTKSPETGIRLARLLLANSHQSDANSLVMPLLATSAYSDAVQLLGKIHFAEYHLDEGRAFLELSHVLHILERRPRESAVDNHELAKIATVQGRFADALSLLETCVAESRRTEDHIIEGYCHLSSGTLLGELNFLEEAHEQFDSAAPLFSFARDLARLELQRGELSQRYAYTSRRISHSAQAVAEFEHAIAYAILSSQTRIMRAAELQLVDSLAELGRTDEATRHLYIARQLDLENIDENESMLLGARIAYHRGDFARATSINERAYSKLAHDDQRLRVCLLQAQIGLKTDDLEATKTWASRAIAISEAKRAAGQTLANEPRQQVLSYELLFSAFARSHRSEDALLALDRWQGETLLDEIMSRKSIQPTVRRDTATQLGERQRLFRRWPMAPVQDRPESRTNMDKIELVALVVANAQVWRIEARHGKVDMTDLGALASLQPLLDQFAATPNTTELGNALGVRLLGAEPFRRTDETLFVMLAGDFSNLPISALRADGMPLVAMRSIVRVSKLSELSCVPAPLAARGAAVIADARDDLPEARREAAEVAASQGVSPTIGRAATRAALFNAMTADVLHIAVHASIGHGGAALNLADATVSALDILAEHQAAPRLVVLSADAAFATAFLENGSKQVVATVRPVTDVGASEFARAFYRGGGVLDPVRMTARVQAQLALTGNTDWANFAVFGHDVCRTTSP